jgi:hypothetical protein
MLLQLSSDFPTGGVVAYPDLTERSAKAKLANNGKYVLQYGRAFISHYLNSGSRDFYNGHKSGRYREALLYAKGQQDPKQYAVLRDDNSASNLIDIAGQKWVENGSGKRTRLDTRPLQVLPKYVDAIMGLLKDRDFTPTITALDTLFAQERDDFMAAMRMHMEHGEWIKSLGLGKPVAPDGQPLPAELPVDEDDLDLFMADFKGKGAMKLEIESAKRLNKAVYADQDKLCQFEDATYGSSFMYLAQAGSQRIPRHVYAGKGFFLPSDNGLYDNLQAGAHLEDITLGAALAEMEASDYTLKPNELDNLKALATRPGTSGRYEYDTDLGGLPEAGGTIQVIRFSFLSTDRNVSVLGKDKLGNPRWIHDKPANYTNPKGHYSEMKTQDIVNVYEGTLVVGTEIGYGARLAHAQLRDPENPFQAHPFYIVTSPGMHGGLSDSLVERARSMADMAAREFMKMQDALSKLPDSAIAVNMGMLAQVTLDGGKTTLTGKELMKSYYEDGVFAYNGIAEDGTALPMPIEQIPIDITQAVSMRRDNVQWCISMIEQITGANGAVAGANVASDQGKGTTELAIQGSQNTLEFLFFAKQSRFERVCRAIVANIKANDEELAGRTMQVRVVQMPTQQQWAAFRELVKTALGTQQITLADSAAIESIDNLSEARRFLATRAKRKRLQDMEDAQKNTDYATQQQTAAAQAAEKFKQQTVQVETQAQMQIKTFDRETQLAVIQAQGDLAERTARLTAEYRLKGVEATVEGANQREVIKQQNAADMHDDRLASNEYIADNRPTPAGK